MDGESTEAITIHVAVSVGERFLKAVMLGYWFDDDKLMGMMEREVLNLRRTAWD